MRNLLLSLLLLATSSLHAACVYSLTGASFPATGGNGSIALTADPGCGWTANADAWITPSPPNGTGNATITFTVAANTLAARVGYVNVAGQNYRVSQAAGSGGSTNTWAQRYGGTGSEVGTVVATDAAGNIYVAGTFRTASIVIGTTTLTNAGGFGTDLWLAKFNSDGVNQWARRYGDTGSEYINKLILDTAGNIYACGYFEGIGNFGGASVTSAGGGDIWLARYAPDGSFAWSHTVGGVNYDVATALTLDVAQTSLLVTGHFQGMCNFETATFNSADGGVDTFLCKYSASTGAATWAKTFVNRGYDTGIGVFTDASDNVILAGYIGTRIDLGNGLLFCAGTNSLNDVYVAKYAPSSVPPATALWSHLYGGVYSDTLYSADLDGNGDVLLGGNFSTQTDLGGGIMNGTGQYTDMFIAKYANATGNHIWSRAITGTLGGTPRAVTVDSANNPVLAGSYQGTSHFGGTDLTSIGNTLDVFVAKYTAAAGALTWARSFGGSSAGGDDCYGVAVDGLGLSALTGGFTGSGTFSGVVLTSAGGNDAYLMRIAP